MKNAPEFVSRILQVLYTVTFFLKKYNSASSLYSDVTPHMWEIWMWEIWTFTQ